jgi:catechol 2,3-dioxygenase-like lactoylglutathione lyase family enzyme
MLADCPAVACVAASDLGRARAFYEGVLGLRIIAHDGFAVTAEAGGVRIRINQPPQVVAAPYTVLNFAVGDIADMVARLSARGVAFERYDWMGEAQDETGVWTVPGGASKVAWFRDLDGNLLSLSQTASA